MNKEEKKIGGTLGEGEASKKNEATSNLLRYEVYQYGDPIEDIDLGELPKDMSDPENWKEIAQVCKEKCVDIICFLDKPHNGSSVVVFRNSGNFLFFGEKVEDQAYDFATNEDVYVFSAKYLEKTIRIYTFWDWDTGYFLYKLDNQDDDDTAERHVTSVESYGSVTNELLWNSSSFKPESF